MKFKISSSRAFYSLFLSQEETSYLECYVTGQKLHTLQVFKNQIAYYRVIDVVAEADCQINFAIDCQFLSNFIDLTFAKQNHPLSFNFKDDKLARSFGEPSSPGSLVWLNNEFILNHLPILPSENRLAEIISGDFYQDIATVAINDWEKLINDSLTIEDFGDDIVPRLKTNSNLMFALEFKLKQLFYEAVAPEVSVWGALPVTPSDSGMFNLFQLQIPSFAIALSMMIIAETTAKIVISEDCAHFKIATERGAIIAPLEPAFFRLATTERQFDCLWTSRQLDLHLAKDSNFHDVLGNYFPGSVPPEYANISFDRQLIAEAIANIGSQGSLVLGKHCKIADLYCLSFYDRGRQQTILSQKKVKDLDTVINDSVLSDLNKAPESYNLGTRYRFEKRHYYSLAEKRAYLPMLLSYGEKSFAWELRQLHDRALPLIVWGISDRYEFYSKIHEDSVPDCVVLALEEVLYFDIGQEMQDTQHQLRYVDSSSLYDCYLNSFISSPLLELERSASILEEYETHSSWQVQYLYF